jgi:hypothetical protein
MIDRVRHSRLLVPILLAPVLALASCGGDDGDGTTDAGGKQAIVVKGAGDIQGDVNEFRRLLGPDNGGAPNGDPEGRREINWDKVPDGSAAPNPLPGDFFNGQADPVARGALLETPGDHVAVSADGDNPAGAAVRFGDINPTYSDEFKTFSAERLFSPVGSNVVNLTFFVPGTDQPGATRGFGAVYTDIDKAENTAFEYFDSNGNSLGKYAAPISEDGLSFLGVVFERPLVARVRIEYGTDKLGPNDSANYDVAVMDDFIYGEPQPAD